MIIQSEMLRIPTGSRHLFLLNFYGYDRKRKKKSNADEIISRRAVFQVQVVFFLLFFLNAGKLPVNSLFRCVRVNFPLFFFFRSKIIIFVYNISFSNFFFLNLWWFTHTKIPFCGCFIYVFFYLTEFY